MLTKNPTVARWRLLGTEYVIAHRNSLDGNGEIATVTVTVNIMMYCSRQYTNRGWNQRGSLFFFQSLTLLCWIRARCRSVYLCFCGLRRGSGGKKIKILRWVHSVQKSAQISDLEESQEDKQAQLSCSLAEMNRRRKPNTALSGQRRLGEIVQLCSVRIKHYKKD